MAIASLRVRVATCATCAQCGRLVFDQQPLKQWFHIRRLTTSSSPPTTIHTRDTEQAQPNHTMYIRQTTNATPCSPNSCDTVANVLDSSSSSPPDPAGLSHRNLIGILILAALGFTALVLWLCFGRWSKPVRQFCRRGSSSQNLAGPAAVQVSFEHAAQGADEKDRRASYASSDRSPSPAFLPAKSQTALQLPALAYRTVRHPRMIPSHWLLTLRSQLCRILPPTPSPGSRGSNEQIDLAG
ncbi:hypothetical protein FA95DRAFT_1563566 [Auriscalpium vulgare]|uniref:Uncharacterized protein n=1 Tax=Auriscalpium vulgare TaxID=40419 RepID=A0ACB8RH29_9AGAM|nr:hypothetical protein FA95DRAFT_1563566 [Auriscalpium vulgare]